MIYPLRLTEGVLFIDNSSLSLINECYRKGAFGLLLRKKQARDETALTFGRIMHSILEERYSRGATTITHEVEQYMFSRAQKEFTAWQPPDGDFRNLDQALTCIERYNINYFTEPFEIASINGHCGTETPFAVPLTEIEVNDTLWVQDLNNPEPVEKFIKTLQVVFTGRMDLAVKDSLGLWLMDHKTTSIGGSQFFSEFYTSMQFKGYAWAHRALTGTLPQGVIINGLVNRRPLKSGKMNIEFLRDHIHINPKLVDEWFDDFVDSVRFFLNAVIEQRFPQQTSACVSKYGKCEFYDVCILAPEQRPIMLNTNNYVDRTWDPILQEEDKNDLPFMP